MSAGKRGFVLAIENPVDSYQVETNFVAYGSFITILTHIPVMRPSGLVDLHQYIPSPLNTANSTKHIAIQPEDEITAVNNDRSMFISMTTSELAKCTKLHDRFWCSSSTISKKANKLSCIKALFMKKQDEINSICILHTITAKEFVVQIGTNTFYAFSPKKMDMFLTCDLDTLDTEKKLLSVQGFFTVMMPHSCTATLDMHVFSTSTDITTQFNIEAKRFHVDFGSLFKDMKINEREIYYIINNPTVKEKITIRDVIKTYDLRRLEHTGRTTSIWTYCTTAAGLGLAIVTCLFIAKRTGLKNFLLRKPRHDVRAGAEASRSPMRTYVEFNSLDTMATDTSDFGQINPTDPTSTARISSRT